MLWSSVCVANFFAEFMELMPVEQHGRKEGEQPVGNLVLVSARSFGFEAAKRGASRAQNIHRVCVRGQLLQNGFQRARQSTERHELFAIRLKFTLLGSLSYNKR